MNQKPVSVTDNETVPPSGDIHDYMSFGPYWWPDPETADGLPYIQKDGQVNPDSRKNGSDKSALGSVIESVETLSLAYHFTNDEKYSAKAVELLRVFFIDPKTRMNPNLNFAQAVPGRSTGRGIGIIDSA